MLNKNNKSKDISFFDKILPDLSSAVVVSFLTIAAGSAFGVLTGLGAQAGILGMIAASLFGWVFGGITVKASGPTGPTASIMLSTIIAIQALNIDISAIYIILAAAGILLIIMGLLPLQNLVNKIPNVATAVFINGVAVLIIVNQITKVLNFHLDDIPVKWWATGMALGSLLFLNVWPKLSGKMQMTKLGRLLSGSLMVMVIGAIVNFLFGMPLPGIMVEGAIFANGFPIDLTLLNEIPIGFLLISSAKIAFIVFFVSVISARALNADAKDYNTELKNIGVANIAAAMVGGLASSIGFVRSKILQNNGGQSIWAGIFTALLVLALLLFAKPLLAQIPVAVFIGILLKAVWGSMDWQFLNDFKADPKRHAFNFALVTIGSISMIWLDQSLVVIVASLLWHLANRTPALANACDDLESCPIATQEVDMMM